MPGGHPDHPTRPSPQCSQREREARRRAAGFGPGERVIAAVANLHPYKGHDDLIRAFARLEPRSRGLRLMVVGRDAGSGPTASSLATRLGVRDAVRFTGQVDNVAELLSIAEFAVHPSHEEGFANAIVEAMSAGKTVAAYDVGGNGEAIVDGETGLLVPSGDTHGLAAAIDELLDDPQRTEAMGRAGRRCELRDGSDGRPLRRLVHRTRRTGRVASAVRLATTSLRPEFRCGHLPTLTLRRPPAGGDRR
ncbi:MAG: glycosyltransferase family 4 protein [Ilumatobacteraceae bacterium]